MKEFRRSRDLSNLFANFMVIILDWKTAMTYHLFVVGCRLGAVSLQVPADHRLLSCFCSSWTLTPWGEWRLLEGAGGCWGGASWSPPSPAPTAAFVGVDGLMVNVTWYFRFLSSLLAGNSISCRWPPWLSSSVSGRVGSKFFRSTGSVTAPPPARSILGRNGRDGPLIVWWWLGLVTARRNFKINSKTSYHTLKIC